MKPKPKPNLFVSDWIKAQVRDECNPNGQSPRSIGCPSKYNIESLLDLVPENDTIRDVEWRKKAYEELGISYSTFYRLKLTLATEKKVSRNRYGWWQRTIEPQENNKEPNKKP